MAERTPVEMSGRNKKILMKVSEKGKTFSRENPDNPGFRRISIKSARNNYLKFAGMFGKVIINCYWNFLRKS